MPLPTLSILLVANLTPTNYKLICAQIKATDNLVWENITLVSSAVPIYELLEIMSQDVKAKI
jgi:hypothetical protein